MKLEPKKELIGDKIILRKLDVTFDNAIIMHEAKINSRDHISPWLFWALPEYEKSPEDSYTFIHDSDEKWNKGTNFEYAVFEKETGKFIGGIGLRRHGFFDCMQYEIGYWLVKDACGKGYMGEVINLIEKEFFALGTERLVIRAEIDNEASCNVAIKAGYVFEGVLRHGIFNRAKKEFRDLKIYSKLSSEFNSQ